MTVLVTMSDHSPGIDQPTRETGFRAALAEYPGCGMDAIKGKYHNYAPLLMMVASADEEVSPKRCEDFAYRNKIEIIVYEGAEHNFDDPGKKSVPLVPTAKWGYLRLRATTYRPRDLAAWAERILAQPWKDAWVFFKHEDAGTGPRLAAALNRALAGREGAVVRGQT